MTDAPTPGTTTAEQQPPFTSADTAPCTLQEFLLYFLRLGTFGGGGLIVLASLGALSQLRKVPEPLVILMAGAVGLLLPWG